MVHRCHPVVIFKTIPPPPHSSSSPLLRLKISALLPALNATCSYFTACVCWTQTHTYKYSCVRKKVNILSPWGRAGLHIKLPGSMQKTILLTLCGSQHGKRPWYFPPSLQVSRVIDVHLIKACCGALNKKPLWNGTWPLEASWTPASVEKEDCLILAQSTWLILCLDFSLPMFVGRRGYKEWICPHHNNGFICWHGNSSGWQPPIFT